MTTKQYSLTLLLVAANLWSSAQITDYYYDARRYSDYGIVGTARSMGMGGANTAVGGDFAAGTLNPAGFGVYQSSELQFSTAFQFIQNRSDFIGATQRANTTNLTIPSVGLVLNVHARKGKSGLRNFTFAFGLNQQENYRRKLFADGFNDRNSITKRFAQLAEGYFNNALAKNPGFFYSTDSAGTEGLAAMAFNTGGLVKQGQDTFPVYIIDNYGSPNTYFGAFQYGKVAQTLDMTERGRLNEWCISGAWNWDDRFYLGVGLGISDLSYRIQHTFIEKDVQNRYQNNVFDTMAVNFVEFRENLEVSGVGINAKLGVIYQPIDEFRFGISIQSPTIMSLSEKYSTFMVLQADAPDLYSYNESGQSLFDYSLLTPYRLNVGGVYFIGKKGLITADFELIDYRLTNFSSSTASNVFTGVNRRIENTFNMGYNVRLGGEYRLNNLYFRAGYALQMPQLNENGLRYRDFSTGSTQSISGTRHTGTAGFGYRGKTVFLDLAYTMQFRNDFFSMYNLRNNELTPNSTNTRTLTNFVLTLGVRFGGNKSDD